MKASLRPLTPREQEFATKNHNLVYRYLHNRKLSIDNFYDIVIFGYLRAVTKYHDRKDLQKYSFSNIAWRCMDTSYANHCKTASGKHNLIYENALRIDAVVNDAENCTLGDLIPSPSEVYLRLEYREFFREIVLPIPILQRKVLQMKLNGYKKHEISKALNASV